MCSMPNRIVREQGMDAGDTHIHQLRGAKMHRHVLKTIYIEKLL
ncbi:MAG: hypothetical protein GFH27_549347n99 [Chloroflexi bacterium AL-W]|nr:hypothetical protein [Chloroflexi bacterium AL-N5]NOK85422.1 hypothetical protein [Chloroflexi bacterium AL-W]